MKVLGTLLCGTLALSTVLDMFCYGGAGEEEWTPLVWSKPYRSA